LCDWIRAVFSSSTAVVVVVVVVVIVIERCPHSTSRGFELA